MPPRSTSIRPRGEPSPLSGSSDSSRSDVTRRPNRHTSEPAPIAGGGRSVVDMHTHTTRSDGVLTPVQLVRTAADAGIKTLAITDHDTLAGIRDLILGRAMPAPIELISGVEINALARGIPLQDGEL